MSSSRVTLRTAALTPAQAVGSRRTVPVCAGGLGPSGGSLSPLSLPDKPPACRPHLPGAPALLRVWGQWEGEEG